MSAPLIGVSGSIRVREGAERAGVNAAYVRSIAQAGGIPVILTPTMGPESAAAILRRMDALVLTGGHDVDPGLYGEPASVHLGPLDRQRDEFEIALFEAARTERLPILGICRGLQVINVAMGGTLWQDLPSEHPSEVLHEKSGTERDARLHSVALNPTSMLAVVLGTDALEINSFHHQAIRDLGRGLSVSARAEDGIIEGVEEIGTDNWLLAVQWHPEEFYREPGSPDQKLFTALVQATTPADVR